jgi:hypothetical protein
MGRRSLGLSFGVCLRLVSQAVNRAARTVQE